MAAHTDTNPPPRPATVRAWVRLMRVQRRLLEAIEGDLKAAGLPPLGWYDVLVELWRTDRGRLRPYELQERTLLAQYNLSRLLDRMARDGFIDRLAFDEDGRGRWVVITEKGLAIRERMWAVYGAALQRNIGEKLDDAEAGRLADLLERVVSEVENP